MNRHTRPPRFRKSSIALAVGTALGAGLYAVPSSACTTDADSQTFTVTATGDATDANDGQLTLREAFAAADLRAGCDTVNFDASLNGQTITLDADTNAGMILINDEVNVVGPGSDQLTITQPTSAMADRAMNFLGADVNLSGLTFDGAGGEDGTLSVYTQTAVLDDVVTQNVVGGQWGGLRAGVGNFTITDSVIQNNQGEFTSGAGASIEICCEPMQSFTLRNTRIADNGGGGQGGGLYLSANSNTTLVIEDVVLSGNTVARDMDDFNVGGGAYLRLSDNTTLAMNNVTVSDNSAEEGGGGIFLNIGGAGVAAEIRNSTFSGNSTANANIGSVLTTGAGGGLMVPDGPFGGEDYALDIVQSTFSGNVAASAGGAIYISDRSAGSAINIDHSTITLNQAEHGGGLFANSVGADINLSHTIVAENTANIAENDIGAIVPNGPPTTVQFLAPYSFVGEANAQVPAATGAQLGAGDPMLAALAEGTGSGTTETHMPQMGSTLIDTGDPALTAGTGDTPATDQNGRPRVVNTRIDIGAVEYNANTAPALSTPITEATVEVGQAIDIDLGDYFSDPDGDALAYTVLNAADVPASITVLAGTVSGTPVEADIGEYTVRYQACDTEPLCVIGEGLLRIIEADSGGGSSSAVGPVGLLATLAAWLGALGWRRRRR